MRWLFFYEDTKIVEMPNVQNCLYLTNVNLINDSGETVETNRLPNSMTNIANAFMGSGIVELTMPNVTTIGDYAFEGCNNLTKVTFGKAALIGEYAFS
ncbi:MAG: leucine-rich repeat protein [Bacteroidales bacterium]|nr:leucine-rich repeat protein [Bacteroidales bacterium]